MQPFDSADKLADAVIERVGPRIVLGLPVGIGKAVRCANALYARAAADPSISVTIFTALSLAPPRGKSELERRFLEPLTARLYGEWPTLAYAEALAAGRMPGNVTLREFYFQPASRLGNQHAQRHYTSLNYTQVAGELLALGVNVIAQLVAPHPGASGRLSLAGNPEVTLDLLPAIERRRASGEAVALVGEVNPRLPYMYGDAELEAERFDYLLQSSETAYPPFGLVNRRVSTRDFATGMHVASLVPDGGTIQLGIGSLSDAVAHCLILRHRQPEVFRHILDALPGGPGAGRPSGLPVEDRPFREGLYAATEMLSDAVFGLLQAGVVSRTAGGGDDALLHAGFYIGSRRFYDELAAMPESERRRIAMTRISFVNSLYGDEGLKRTQRRGARYVNEAMMVTLLGAAISDALENGQVVSGVGGQFDFVRLGHALEGARSILVFAATRRHRGKVRSNVVWNYGHTTVPRHFRDLFVNEYGIADCRGRSDEETIIALLGITGRRFHDRLAATAKSAGKLRDDYRAPESAVNNTAAAVSAAFGQFSEQFPEYPLGTDLTSEEQELARALEFLKRRSGSRLGLIGTVLRALFHRPGKRHAAALRRMGLDRPATIRERATARTVAYALAKTARRSS